MNFIKEKIKTFWMAIVAVIAGIFITTQFLPTPLGEVPPEDTIYKIEHSESFDYITCKRDYECNKQAFLDFFINI